MIDVSDGLGRDVSHLAEQSEAQLELDSQRIPCREGLAWRRAMSDGEDYELCFTASGEVPGRIGDLPITRVGRVVKRGGPARVLVRDGGETIDGSQLGWEHRS